MRRLVGPRSLIALGLVVALAYPWVLRSPYYHVLGFNVVMFATMATGWNILGGFAGYKSLGHSAFFGLGAYATALSANHLGWHPMVSAPFTSLAVAVVALGLGWIALRTSGTAFVLATIALLLIFRTLALNARDVTGGASGLSLPLPPWSPEFSRMPFYYYMLGGMLVALMVSSFVRSSRFGLGLQAIRDDDGKAEMVGVGTTLYKVIAFGLSAYFVALAGGVWAYFSAHISPVFAFNILVDVDIVLSTMLGGLGTIWGPVLGALIIVPARELILFQFESSTIHLTVFGGLMIAIIALLPRGIIPSLADWFHDRRRSRSVYTDALTADELARSHQGGAAEADRLPSG